MKNDILKYILAVIPAVLMLSGCARELPVSPDQPYLTAVIENGGAVTKASYDNNEGKFKWTEGDQIVVPYDGNRVETYDLSINSTTPSQATFLSSLKGADGRVFYAVYPAYAWVTPSSGATAPTVNLKSSYDEYASIIAGTSTLTGDYSPVPMVALNDPSSNILDFRHVGGLLRIYCNDMDPTTKTVVVTFDKDVTGNYLVNVNDPDEPFIQTAGSSSNNQVTFTVASSSAGIGSSVTSFTLNVPVPCGVYYSVKIEAFNNAGQSLRSIEYKDYPISFARHHGKRLSFAESIWNYHLDGIFDDVETDYTGGLETITVDMESYKEDDDDNKIPVPFEIQYSDTGEDGTWTTTKPDWVLLGGGIDYNGSTDGQTIKVSISPQANSVPMNNFGVPEDNHTLKLRSNTPATSDLSKYNVATGSVMSSSSTANCYVVQATGTYRFPLVYGNAIKNGSLNQSAFQAKDNHGEWMTEDYDTSNPDGYIAAYFKDHLDANIKKPYIADHLHDKGLSIASSELLWMDAPGLIESVSYSPGNASDYTDDYISFTITPEGICQGNAIIAIRDNQDRIVWSWHIWVTDADLTKTETGADGSQISTLNLGWCDRRMIEKYEERSCYIRFVQTAPEGYASDPILIKMDEGPTIYRAGNAPFYNFGRKDPMPGSDGNIDLPEDKPCYSITNDVFLHEYAVPSAGTVGQGIQHPDYQYYNEGYNTWCVPSFQNAWNSTYSVNADIVTKTVYDPSPVGYKVTPFIAYSPGMNLSTLGWVDNYTMEMIDADGNTYDQDMGPGRVYGNLFFPALGSRSLKLTDVGQTGIFVTTNSSYYNGGFQSSYMRYTTMTVICTGGSSATCESVRFTLDN